MELLENQVSVTKKESTHIEEQLATSLTGPYSFPKSIVFRCLLTYVSTHDDYSLSAGA